MSDLVVEPESTRADRRAFLGFPYRLYANEPRWVPPLRMADGDTMDPRKNPFFQHAQVRHFLARRGGRVVGRIAAIENRLHNEVHGDRLGFFGWFDVEPDPEATTALVAAAHAWTAQRGLDGMRGPVCYSTNDVCGVLVDGFAMRPALLMPWNREDYDALLKGAGLAPVKDVVAYGLDLTIPIPERHARIAKRMAERSAITLRPIDLNRWASEVEVLRDLYNRSWERNWGFVPMTEAEFSKAAKDLRMLVDPRVFLIAEKAGEPVGFIGSIPDVNGCLVGLDGRLFPFGLLRFLWRKRRVHDLRTLLLGVVPEARGRGLDVALIVGSMHAAKASGYAAGEAGWVLEDNARMRRDIESLGWQVTKRYRFYEARGSVAPTDRAPASA